MRMAELIDLGVIEEDGLVRLDDHGPPAEMLHEDAASGQDDGGIGRGDLFGHAGIAPLTVVVVDPQRRAVEDGSPRKWDRHGSLRLFGVAPRDAVPAH